ncbi:hypothetical protein BHE74_00042846 [Ensete ventricosum]|nr:hypothetical protein GW17_00042545 [Ensete ventricosum]RWW50854.1 hypothetical protein BHE74_00042846 [Ensete ventricosum]
MYTAVAEEGSNGMEREMATVVFNLLLAAIKIVGSERFRRDNRDQAAERLVDRRLRFLGTVCGCFGCNLGLWFCGV